MATFQDDSFWQNNIGTISQEPAPEGAGSVFMPISASYDNAAILGPNGEVITAGYQFRGGIASGITAGSYTGYATRGWSSPAICQGVIIGKEGIYAVDADGKLWGAGEHSGTGANNQSLFYNDAGFPTPGSITNVHVGRGCWSAFCIDTTVTPGVYAIGLNNGRLGTGDTAEKYTWTATNLDAAQIAKILQAPINRDTYAMYANGQVLATGSNDQGRLGVGDTSSRTSFTATNITDAVDIFANSWNGAFAVRANGDLYATGSNWWGELGLGATANVTSFTDTGLGNVRLVDGAYQGTWAVTNDNKLYFAGENDNFGSGGMPLAQVYNTFTEVPVPWTPGAAIKQIFRAQGTGLVLLEDGSLYATGRFVGNTVARNGLTLLDTGVFVINGWENGILIVKLDGSVFFHGDSTGYQDGFSFANYNNTYAIGQTAALTTPSP